MWVSALGLFFFMSVLVVSIGNVVLPTLEFPPDLIQASRVSKDVVVLATIVSDNVGEYSRNTIEESVSSMLGLETLSLVVDTIQGLGISKFVIGPMTIVSDSVGACSITSIEESVPIVLGVPSVENLLLVDLI